MKTIKKSEPFFHKVYVGTDAERLAIPVENKTNFDKFYCTDTGNTWCWSGGVWTQTETGGVPHVVST